MADGAARANPVDQCQEVDDVQGFCHELDRAPSQHPASGHGGRVGSKDDDRDIRGPRVCLEFAKDLVSRDIRQMDIEQDEIWLVRPG